MEPNQPSTDEQLAQSAWVRRLARNMLRDPALAEDAAQLGSIAAWQHGPLDSHSRASWLATTVRRFAGRLARGEARRSARERSAARGEALPSTAELVERAEAHRALVAAVLALEEPYRSTVLLRYVEDLPPRAIARRAGVPVATVKTRLARALERLRKTLEAEHGDAREWLGLLVPLVHPYPAPALVLGTTLVKSLKITAAALLVLLLGMGLFYFGRTRMFERSASGLALGPAESGSVADSQAAPAEVSGNERVGLGPDAAAASSTPANAIAALEKFHGRVLDLRGQPIAGATIRVLHSPSSGYEIFDVGLRQEFSELALVRSDAQGEFAFELVCGTVVDLDVHADGYADEHLAEKFGAGELVIRLGQGAVLLGEVTRFDDGLPVAGALVRVSCGKEDAIERLARTDALGRYRFDDLTPGRIGLIVAPVGEALSAWAEHELRPGETFRRDFQVRTGERLRGRVIDASTGTPVAGAEVSAFDFIYKSARTDAHGEFEIAGLDQRQLSLAVRADGYGRLDQRVLEFGTPVELGLHPGRRAHGRVLGPEGAPLEGAFVAALGITERGRETRSARSDAGGGFELTDLRTDIGDVLLLRAESCGSSYFAFPVVEPGASSIELGDLHLERAAFLEGRVLDDSGRARAGVQVTLNAMLSDPQLKAMGDLHGTRSLESDATGRFVFRDLQPGDWVLAARGAGLLSPEKLQLHLSAGELRRGLEVRLGLGLAIEGLVRDLDGHPLQDARVSVSGEKPTRGWGSCSTDEDGRFLVSALSAGNFTVEVTGPGSELTTQGRFDPAELRHVQAGCAALDLRLRERTSRIRGRVLDVAGAPVPGAFVWKLTGGGIPPGEFVLSDADGRFEIAVLAGSALQLMARRGMPLVQSLRTPTHREARAGRVMLDDPEPLAVSDTVQAGSEGVELRIPRE